MPFPPTHPASEKKAAWFHLALAAYYALGLWFHVVSTYRHYRDRDTD